MIIPPEYAKFKNTPLDCPIYDKNNPDYRCSIDYDKTNYRKSKAMVEARKDRIELSYICKLIDEFLKKVNIKSVCKIINNNDALMAINYEVIKKQYKLNRQSDIVWMKFTEDGYLGVVASSNDINFNDNNNSYKLINHVGKKWNKNLILIVPLPQISYYERLLIEKMLGNYLIDNNVPIIDYYSHNLQCTNSNI